MNVVDKGSIMNISIFLFPPSFRYHVICLQNDLSSHPRAIYSNLSLLNNIALINNDKFQKFYMVSGSNFYHFRLDICLVITFVWYY